MIAIQSGPITVRALRNSEQASAARRHGPRGPLDLDHDGNALRRRLGQSPLLYVDGADRWGLPGFRLFGVPDGVLGFLLEFEAGLNHATSFHRVMSGVEVGAEPHRRSLTPWRCGTCQV